MSEQRKRKKGEKAMYLSCLHWALLVLASGFQMLLLLYGFGLYALNSWSCYCCYWSFTCSNDSEPLQLTRSSSCLVTGKGRQNPEQKLSLTIFLTSSLFCLFLLFQLTHFMDAPLFLSESGWLASLNKISERCSSRSHNMIDLTLSVSSRAKHSR